MCKCLSSFGNEADASISFPVVVRYLWKKKQNEENTSLKMGYWTAGRKWLKKKLEIKKRLSS